MVLLDGQAKVNPGLIGPLNFKTLPKPSQTRVARARAEHSMLTKQTLTPKPRRKHVEIFASSRFAGGDGRPFVGEWSVFVTLCPSG